MKETFWGDNSVLERTHLDTLDFSCMVVEDRHSGKDMFKNRRNKESLVQVTLQKGQQHVVEILIFFLLVSFYISFY